MWHHASPNTPSPTTTTTTRHPVNTPIITRTLRRAALSNNVERFAVSREKVVWSSCLLCSDSAGRLSFSRLKKPQRGSPRNPTTVMGGSLFAWLKGNRWKDVRRLVHPAPSLIENQTVSNWTLTPKILSDGDTLSVFSSVTLTWKLSSFNTGGKSISHSPHQHKTAW